jgi:hypothetical protein
MELYEKVMASGDTQIHDRYVYILQSDSGNIEIPITGKLIKEICDIGSNDAAVEKACENWRVKEKLAQYTDEELIEELSEYGVWNEDELKSRKNNEARIVWCLAWDVFDSENPNEYLAIDELQIYKTEQL